MNKKGQITMVEVMIMVAIITLLLAIIIPNFIKSKIEAKLYNQKFGTNYSMYDFMFSSETIKEFLGTGKQTTQNIKIEGSIPVKIEN